jgi:hypothetical protein
MPMRRLVPDETNKQQTNKIRMKRLIRISFKLRVSA